MICLKMIIKKMDKYIKYKKYKNLKLEVKMLLQITF